MNLRIEVITVGKWNVNSYLLVLGSEAWIIDPGDDFEILNKAFKLNSYQLKGVINTHGHFDHIAAVAEITETFDIPFYIHSKDKRLVSQGNIYRKLAGDSSLLKTPKIHKFLDDYSYLPFNNKKIFLYHTPGHTSGSVCFQIENYLFSGDLFYKHSLGRTDLPGGNKELLMDSIGKIFVRFKDYQIFPGHGLSFILDENTINSLLINTI